LKASGKRARAWLVRRYGFGVPSFDRALRSASNALTLIAQDSIRPFVPKATNRNDRQMGDIHFFALPSPREVLQSLGETPARLRVTLSYFIEPNPGRRGWKNRHRHASHGLRFEVKGPTESMEEFRKRLNQRALEGRGEARDRRRLLGVVPRRACAQPRLDPQLGSGGHDRTVP
jgi:hypothetical protein